jgi:signal transduction histidine kinase
MPEGGELSVSLDADGQDLAISIRDNGAGIPPQNLPKIFSPFFTTKEAGNGLGLADVQKAIHAHHGTIEAFSEEGNGSEFVIKIPLKLGE